MQTTFAIGSRLLKRKLERILGPLPENTRDDLLGRHFARTQRVLARPSPPASARANRLVRFPSRDFGTVTPYRSPSYTPSP
jgi:hypothetical protein